MTRTPSAAEVADELAGLAGGLAALLPPFAPMAFGAVALLILVAVPLAALALALALAVAAVAAPLLAARAVLRRLTRRPAPARTAAPALRAAGSPACGRWR